MASCAALRGGAALPERSRETPMVFIPIRGAPWQCVAKPGHFNSLVRELVLGPAAPEFGSPDSHFPEGVEGLEAETLEIHLVKAWEAKGFPSLLVVLDAEGIGKGLKPNPRASWVLNGGADPNTASGLLVHGPACVLAEDENMDETAEPATFGKEELMRLLATRGKGSVDSTWETGLEEGAGEEAEVELEVDVLRETRDALLSQHDSDDDEEMVEVE
jgi:hypothetical protein